jgi:hypothetical protein
MCKTQKNEMGKLLVRGTTVKTCRNKQTVRYGHAWLIFALQHTDAICYMFDHCMLITDMLWISVV